MGIWIVLVLVALIVWIPQISRKQQEQASTSASNQNRTNLWTSPLAWYISIFMGLQSMLYCGISWLPDILKSQGMSSDTAGWTVIIMQMALLPVTFIVPILAGRMKNQNILVILAAVFYFIGIGGFLSGNDTLTLLWAILIGIGSGCAFSLAMMLFVLQIRMTWPNYQVWHSRWVIYWQQ